MRKERVLAPSTRIALLDYLLANYQYFKFEKIKTFAKHIAGKKNIFKYILRHTAFAHFLCSSPVKAFMANKNTGAYIFFFLFKQIDMS